MERKLVLTTANRAVSVDRQKVHGDAATNLAHTANLLNAYFGYKKAGDVISAKDVAMVNILQKMSRSCFNEKHADHYVDIAGYAALAADITDAK